MKATLKMLLIIISFSFIISCTNTVSPEDPIISDDNSKIESIKSNPFIKIDSKENLSEDDIVEFLKGIDDYIIVSKIKIKYENRQVWKIKVKTKKSGEIEYKVDIKLGVILKIHGKYSPYNYDIKPIDGFISLQEAFNLLFNKYKGTVEEWEIEFDDNLFWKYKIKVLTNSGKLKIEIKAKGGLIIKTEEVKDDDSDKSDDD